MKRLKIPKRKRPGHCPQCGLMFIGNMRHPTEERTVMVVCPQEHMYKIYVPADVS